VSEYEAGYKAGDVEQIIKLSAEPFCLVLRESFDHIKLVGKAKRNLLAAMDEKFGKQAGTIPYGIDDDKIRQRMKRVVSFYLMDHETNLGLNVTLSIAAKLTNGREETWKLVAVRQADGGWKLWPHKADGMSEIGTTESWRVNMTKLARAYDEVTILVQAGRIASREAAQQTAFESYSRVMSPGFGTKPATNSPPAKEAPASLPDVVTQRKMEDRATMSCLLFTHAVGMHRQGLQRWPETLEVMLGKYVDAKTINDPWGKPIQYSITRNENGVEQAYVWTTSPYGDGKKVIGIQPPKQR